MSLNPRSINLLLILAMAVIGGLMLTCCAVVVIDELNHIAPDATATGLLAFVTGSITNILSFFLGGRANANANGNGNGNGMSNGNGAH